MNLLGTDGKEAASHDRRLEWFSGMFKVLRQQWESFVIKLPVKRPPRTLILRHKNWANLLSNFPLLQRLEEVKEKEKHKTRKNIFSLIQ